MFRPAGAATMRSFSELKKKSPGTCLLFRPASAATLRSFAEFKKSPERVQACKCCHHADFSKI
jgi:hypothetical protein